MSVGGKSIAIALLAITIAAAPAAALSPDQVLVVGNSASADSVALAQYYAEARGIPAGNIVLVKTTTEYDITRDAYDTQIRAPLIAAMQERHLTDKIRCICLIWGVPVRVGAAPAAADDGGLAAVQKAAYREAHARLLADSEYLATVAVKFPRNVPAELKPLERLFGPLGAAGSVHASVKLDDLKEQIITALVHRQAAVAAINDPDRRLIASRQLMALYLDVQGLRGLISYIEVARPAAAPPLEELKRQLAQAEQDLAANTRQPLTAATLKQRLALLETTGGLALAAFYNDSPPAPSETTPHKATIRTPRKDASVDSELSLLLCGQYELDGPLSNPLHWEAIVVQPPPVLMTARIDGPTRADALRLIKNSIRAEKAGLRGKMYVDAGGPVAEYDRRLKRLYRMVRTETQMEAVLNENDTVFAPRSCPEAALYVGWYSPQRYVPSMMWVPGAVAWHVSSFEAQRLRDADSLNWCPQMIRNGVAATIGAVNEPTLGAFPVPEEFFYLLLTGKYTVAEAYWRTMPHTSWRLTLIADPLYNPFAAAPRIAVEDLPKNLRPQE